MKLENDFYTIESFERTADGFICVVTLSVDHPVYRGHFPGSAVVPGVYSLAMVRECASRAMGRDVTFKKIEECKFVSVLLPVEKLMLNLNFTIDDNGRVTGLLSRYDDNRVVLKLKAKLE